MTQDLFNDANFLRPLVSGVTPETRETSTAAAESVESTKDTQRQSVFEAIREAGDFGRTDDEIQVRLGIEGNSERPRRRELQTLDRIVMARDSYGEVVKRQTSTGRKAVVWVVNS